MFTIRAVEAKYGGGIFCICEIMVNKIKKTFDDDLLDTYIS